MLLYSPGQYCPPWSILNKFVLNNYIYGVLLFIDLPIIFISGSFKKDSFHAEEVHRALKFLIADGHACFGTAGESRGNPEHSGNPAGNSDSN
jgi:hypothetical protein